MNDEKNPADGPGEAVIDEPTEHALDEEPDPNTEWEKDAADQEKGSGEGEDREDSSTAENEEPPG
ncbi:MAG: hypothetical protein ACRDLB_16405 [Actinomycetota bacterium]